MSFIIQWIENCEGPEQVVKINTPVAKLVLSYQWDVITSIDWELNESPVRHSGHPLQNELDRFWTGGEKTIHVKLLKQGSDYRNTVWAELCKIPFGTTITYSELARHIGSSARAVGNACRDNPYPLIVPCHRVVSVSGLGGYSGQTEGDLMAIKIKLLQLESACKT